MLQINLWLFKVFLQCIDEWFFTDVPRNTRVPLGGAKGDAKSCLALAFGLFLQLGVPQDNNGYKTLISMDHPNSLNF